MRSASAFSLVAVLSSIGFGAEPAETITITASATVFVKPDTARVHFNVRATEQSVDAAKEAVSKQVKLMGESIKGLKMSELTTSTGASAYGRVSSSAAIRKGGLNPAAPAPGPRVIYSASVPITATIREKDADKLLVSVDTFVKKVVEAGATIIGDSVDPDSAPLSRTTLAADAPRIDWLLTDDSVARRTALRSAFQKAKADATTLSKELGWDKVTIFSVSDGPSLVRDPNEPAAAASRNPAGELPVSVRVTIKCSR